MNSITSDIFLAVIMVVTAVFLIAWFLRYKAGASERRLQEMLERCGVNPELIATGDTQAIIREVRRQCRKCQTEAVCERWLVGIETGDNSFCPNARTIELLAKSSQPV